MSDEQLNTAIDEVARRMTEGSPAGDAGFRRRLLARIEAGDAPRARWRPLFVIVPLAAVAAIVLALVVARQAVRLPPSPSGVGETRKPDTADVARATVLPPSPNGFGETRKPRVVGDGLKAAPDESGAYDNALPIDAIDAIAVAPLLVDTLTPDSIQIPRLDAVVPIAVAPLDITDAQRREP